MGVGSAFTPTHGIPIGLLWNPVATHFLPEFV